MTMQQPFHHKSHTQRTFGVKILDYQAHCMLMRYNITNLVPEIISIGGFGLEAWGFGLDHTLSPEPAVQEPKPFPIELKNWRSQASFTAKGDSCPEKTPCTPD